MKKSHTIFVHYLCTLVVKFISERLFPKKIQHISQSAQVTWAFIMKTSFARQGYTPLHFCPVVFQPQSRLSCRVTNQKYYFLVAPYISSSSFFHGTSESDQKEPSQWILSTTSFARCSYASSGLFCCPGSGHLTSKTDREESFNKFYHTRNIEQILRIFCNRKAIFTYGSKNQPTFLGEILTLLVTITKLKY